MAEDEERMAEALIELLRMEGYEVAHTADGKEALEALKTGLYDIAVLDVMMPSMSGYEVVRKARKAGVGIPVLILTAREEEEDMVAGLDAGADDYLTKPFRTKELLARLRAISRRSGEYREDRLCFGDLLLHPENLSLSCLGNDRNVRLGEKEFRLLEYFFANRGAILTREQLALRLWGYESEAEYNNVEVYVSFTRKKIAFVGSKASIKAVRGVGYELRYPDVQ